jgi:hypothetical protein
MSALPNIEEEECQQKSAQMSKSLRWEGKKMI